MHVATKRDVWCVIWLFFCTKQSRATYFSQEEQAVITERYEKSKKQILQQKAQMLLHIRQERDGGRKCLIM